MTLYIYKKKKIFYRNETALRPQTDTDVVNGERRAKLSRRTFTKSDRFQLPAGAGSATAGNLQFYRNGMQFFVVEALGITDFTRRGVKLPRVLPCVAFIR